MKKLALLVLLSLAGCGQPDYTEYPCPMSEDGKHHFGQWVQQPGYVQARTCTNCNIGEITHVKGSK